jgi:hypothetical protein
MKIEFISKSSKEKILAAAEALKIFNGHDAYQNLNSRYGSRWWEKISKIENDLREIL